MTPKKNENQKIIDQLQLYYNWAENTKKTYIIHLNKYSKIHNMTLQELIQEAEQDEETINKVNKRKIKERLMQYILHEKQNNIKITSIKQAISHIKKMYKHYDIDIPTLPPLPADITSETFDELPTKKQITDILIHTNLKQKTIITFLASTGLRRSDACNLTIKNFKEAIKEYVTSQDIINIIYEIENKDDLIIPTWKIISQKTKIKHITFNSDESTRLICKLLKQRLLKGPLKDNDSLFGYTPPAVSIMFERLNDELNLGFVGSKRFFHAHVLRKYFTTSLYNDGVDFLFVDFLAGHALPPVRAAYYKANPLELKKVYLEHLDLFTFMSVVSCKEVGLTGDELEELEMLREYKKSTDKRLDELESLVRSILE